MAWSWSHTNEAYAAVEANIRAQSREWLEEVWAEWVAARGHTDNPKARPWNETFWSEIHFFAQLDLRRYHLAIVRAKRKSSKELADFIWEKTQKLATCTNGGWEAWCCPFGRQCHMVPFDTQEEIEEPNRTLTAKEQK